MCDLGFMYHPHGSAITSIEHDSLHLVLLKYTNVYTSITIDITDLTFTTRDVVLLKSWCKNK